MSRTLNWPDCQNVRDLGGLAAGHGTTVRPGALIRSDNLDRLTPEGIEAVRQAGISRIIDVRSKWECQHFPSPFSRDPIWRNAPLADPDAPSSTDVSLVEQYAALLDGYPGGSQQPLLLSLTHRQEEFSSTVMPVRIGPG